MEKHEQSLVTLETDFEIKSIYSESFAKEWAFTNKWGVTIEENNTDISDSPSIKITWQRGWGGIDIGLKKSEERSDFGSAEFSHIQLHIHTKGRLLNMSIEPRLEKDDDVKRRVAFVANSNDFQLVKIPLQPYGDDRFVAIRIQNDSKSGDIPPFYIKDVQLVHKPRPVEIDSDIDKLEINQPIAITRERGTQAQLIGSPQTFNEPLIWTTRLHNIMTVCDSLEREAKRQVQTYFVMEYFDEEGSANNLDLNEVPDFLGQEYDNFEQDQIKRIHSMLKLMQTFGRGVLSHYTPRLLPTDIIEEFVEIVEETEYESLEPTQDLGVALPGPAPAVNIVGIHWDSEKEGAQPPTHLLRKVFHEFSTDLNCINLALEQRKKSLTKNFSGLKPRTLQATHLLYTDLLARESLRPAYPLLCHITQKSSLDVLTYFTDSINIRILPYFSEILLIGLPTTEAFLEPGGSSSALIPWNLLMLPHEVGHFLFWNGKKINGDNESGNEKNLLEIDDILRDTLINTLKIKESDWRYHWLEELFSDVYACLIMGPMFILGLQVVLSDAAKEEWFLDNGSHPIPAIRPFIGSLILEQIHKKGLFPNVSELYGEFSEQPSPSDGFPNAIKQLDANWDSLLNAWEFEDQLESIKLGRGFTQNAKGDWFHHDYRDQSGDDEMGIDYAILSYNEIETELIPVIDAILDILADIPKFWTEIGSPYWLFDQFPWGIELGPEESLDLMTQRIEAFLQSQLQNRGVPIDAPISNEFCDESILRSSPEDRLEKLLEEIDGLEGTELAIHLKTHFCDIWGDKGPRGGGFRPGG